jgi:hypothetical protein
MFKKFADGLLFGAGFAISFTVLWYAAAFLVTPMFFSSQMERAASKQSSDSGANTQPSIPRNYEALGEPATPFHELKLEEQIKTASVIALARYEQSPDGRMKAIIKEFLKKEPGTTIYYNIGDEYPDASYYPKEHVSYGDGVIIFFTNSPARMAMSMTYSGDRIRGLGDLPVELLRKKCKDPDA